MKKYKQTTNYPNIRPIDFRNYKKIEHVKPSLKQSFDYFAKK